MPLDQLLMAREALYLYVGLALYHGFYGILIGQASMKV